MVPSVRSNKVIIFVSITACVEKVSYIKDVMHDLSKLCVEESLVCMSTGACCGCGWGARAGFTML